MVRVVTRKLRSWECFTAALLGSALFVATQPHASETIVKTKADLPNALAAVSAGDTVSLADGYWDDVEIKISESGSAEHPILLRAQNPGKAILRNTSHVIFDGKYIIISGLFLQGTTTTTRAFDAIAFSANSGQCLLTQTAIDNYNSSAGAKDNWVVIEGFQNHVEYCSFTGKKIVGELLRVKRDANKSDQHVIAHNYFGARSPVSGNGGEEIQIGLKETQFTESNTTVEYNLFEDCNGEIEGVSVKSGGNIIRFNTLLRCQSHITLRHGAGSVVEGNYIDGRGVSGTGGIRVYNKNHSIVNNFFTGLRGNDEVGGGVNVQSGDNTDPVKDPANHVPAQNCLVAFNTFVDNFQGIVYGGTGTAPSNITIANNLLTSSIGSLFTMNASTPFAKLEGNILYGSSLGITKQTGITVVDPLLDKTTLNSYPFYLPAPGSPALGHAAGAYTIPGWTDPLPPPDVGQNLFGLEKLQPLVRSQVGPAWNGGPAPVSIRAIAADPRKHAGYLGASLSSANRFRFDAAGRRLGFPNQAAFKILYTLSPLPENSSGMNSGPR